MPLYMFYWWVSEKKKWTLHKLIEFHWWLIQGKQVFDLIISQCQFRRCQTCHITINYWLTYWRKVTFNRLGQLKTITEKLWTDTRGGVMAEIKKNQWELFECFFWCFRTHSWPRPFTQTTQHFYSADTSGLCCLT